MKTARVRQRAMLCPSCSNPTRVYSSESQIDGSVLRRRQCRRQGCWRKFRTSEQVLSDESATPGLTA